MTIKRMDLCEGSYSTTRIEDERKKRLKQFDDLQQSRQVLREKE